MSSADLNGTQKVGGEAEETLRLLARIAIPEGLEDRVHARLVIEPRSGRVLAWPRASLPGASGWMRSAAAAAIVFVVAGGGWSIYSRVQPAPPAKAIVVSPHLGTGGGFSEGAAVRRPQTLQGPVVKPPVTTAKGKGMAKGTNSPANVSATTESKKTTAALAASPAQ